MKMQKTLKQVSLAVCTLFVLSESAYAYLDPGTGSIILQGLIATIALGLSTIKLWWHRLTGLFSRKKPEAEQRVDE